MRIDFVAPPFAGHLFPQLDLASQLRDRGSDQIHFLSTQEAEQTIRSSKFRFTPILSGASQAVMEIANTRTQVGSNPLRLLSQFKLNLGLMHRLRQELLLQWQAARPDLVIVDFTVPIAGLLAQSMGIRWWTSMPTICVLETGNGTPSYLGGWSPMEGRRGKLRDWAGRATIRCFKLSIHYLFRKQLAALGVGRIYREDGLESIYSPDTILGFGIPEVEFPRAWPQALVFVGPMTASPALPHIAPTYVEGRPHVLISLGTHLQWAKSGARELIRTVAKQMPDWVFHFTGGVPGECSSDSQENFHCYGYVPYDAYIERYKLVIHHGGTGVMYSSLKRGIPALVWPMDYDQFDHAARLVYGKLGLRCRPSPNEIVVDLQQLANDQTIQRNVVSIRQKIAGYTTADLVLSRMRGLQ